MPNFKSHTKIQSPTHKLSITTPTNPTPQKFSPSPPPNITPLLHSKNTISPSTTKKTTIHQNANIHTPSTPPTNHSHIKHINIFPNSSELRKKSICLSAELKKMRRIIEKESELVKRLSFNHQEENSNHEDFNSLNTFHNKIDYFKNELETFKANLFTDKIDKNNTNIDYYKNLNSSLIKENCKLSNQLNSLTVKNDDMYEMIIGLRKVIEEFKDKEVLLQKSNNEIVKIVNDAIEKSSNLTEEIDKEKKNDGNFHLSIKDKDKNKEKLKEIILKIRKNKNALRLKIRIFIRSMLSEFNLIFRRLKSEYNKIIINSSEEINKLKSIKKEDEENKKLVNFLKDSLNSEREKNENLRKNILEMKGNIRVFCRIKPPKDLFNKIIPIKTISENKLFILEKCYQLRSINKVSSKKRIFGFDRVYGKDNTSGDIFGDIRNLIHSAVEGYNVCVFAYGQTGSGKTYTMEGTNKHPGINLMSFKEMFNFTESRKDSISYEFTMSVFEIYNEKVRDLLSDDKINDLSIHEDKDEGIFIPKLKIISITSAKEIENIYYNKAIKNRSVGISNINTHSSRSHCITIIKVKGSNHYNHSISSGRLILVDLAGSERVLKSGAVDDNLKEAKNINRSLSSLGDVFFALYKKTNFVPFRNSKLTYILKDYLGGNAKILMICQVSSEVDDLTESACTLKFAERVKKIELGAATKTIGNFDYSMQNRLLQEKIHDLRLIIKKNSKSELNTTKNKEIKRIRKNNNISKTLRIPRNKTHNIKKKSVNIIKKNIDNIASISLKRKRKLEDKKLMEKKYKRFKYNANVIKRERNQRYINKNKNVEKLNEIKKFNKSG